MNSCNFQGKSEIDLIFEQTKKIDLLAFYDRDQWEKEDYPSHSYKVNYLKNNKVNIKEKYLRNKITLNQIQIGKLKDSLESCKPQDGVAMCYMPRHSLIFYDNNDKIFGYIEICFDCNRTESSKNLEFLSDCVLWQKELFKEFGITYFNETEEEIEVVKKKREIEMIEFKKNLKNKQNKN